MLRQVPNPNPASTSVKCMARVLVRTKEQQEIQCPFPGLLMAVRELVSRKAYILVQ